MLKLINIKKDYLVADSKVEALRGISINFRKSEFVSILGPSGCGKTTLLNIIGGLDKYTSGDLFISGRSTKKFTDRDWDVYRNHRVGFVFQSYNLIPHQTILGNVELALTIAGLKKEERVAKAKKALERVGLAGQYNKHPNQLSGGQCQRVAIARALVNDPEILLADEPTGALDTVTSVQIMELIKEIAKDRLVIMVTHNPDLAEKYSTRIVRLLDGELQSDTDPYDLDAEEDDIPNDVVLKEKAKMSMWTAFKLSARNLVSKLKRTVMVCFAGSIGIIGISLVLAISSGVTGYIDGMQDDMLSGNPITIAKESYDLESLFSNTTTTEQKAALDIVDGKVNVNSLIEQLVAMNDLKDSIVVENTITQAYIDYIKSMPDEYYSAFLFDYGIDVSNNIYTDFKKSSDDTATNMSLSSITNLYTGVLGKTDYADYATYIQQLANSFAQAPDSESYILEQYDLVGGSKVATEANEVMLVISDESELTDVLLAQLGYYTQEEFLNVAYKAAANRSNDYKPSLDKERFDYSELLGKKFTYYPNESVYTKNTSATASIYPYYYNYKSDGLANGMDLEVVGILRPKDDISYGCLTSGFYYSKAFSDYFLETNKNSTIANEIRNSESQAIASVTSNGISTGITYELTFEFDGVEYPQTCIIGSSDSYAAIMGMFMGGSGSGSAITTMCSLSLYNVGGSDIPMSISIYPTNFEQKDFVTDYLDVWNSEEDIIINGTVSKYADRNEIVYTDTLELIINIINTMINMITYALVAFTAISLVVSTVMIGIITYVSVVERVKEIGVIRSLGGRKKDVSHLFNAETFIIGFASGLFGIIVTYLISLVINLILGSLTGIYTLASLPISQAIIMIIISVILTLISGLIPARAAARKNPVDALRSE